MRKTTGIELSDDAEIIFHILGNAQENDDMSMESIAEKASMSEEATQLALKELESKGLAYYKSPESLIVEAAIKEIAPLLTIESRNILDAEVLDFNTSRTQILNAANELEQLVRTNENISYSVCVVALSLAETLRSYSQQTTNNN